MNEDRHPTVQVEPRPAVGSSPQETVKGADRLTTAQRILLWIVAALSLAVALVTGGLVLLLILEFIIIYSGEWVPGYFAPQYFLIWLVPAALVCLLASVGLVACIKRLRKRVD